MNRTGVALLTALALAGGTVGYVASQTLGAPAESSRPGTPAVATPAQPEATVIPVVADPTDPPMPAKFEMTRSTLVSGPLRITYPVPVDWAEAQPTSDTRKYKPVGYGEDTYVLRVRDMRSTQADLATSFAEGLRAVAYGQHNFQSFNHTENSFEYSYVSKDDRQQRYGFRAWLDLDDNGRVDVEFNINGRSVDTRGGYALMQRLLRETKLER